MRDKKEKNEKTPEREALERQVDAMMDPKRPDPVPAPSAEPGLVPPAEPAAAPAPIAADMDNTESLPSAKTAPELSPRLRKKIPVDHDSEEPDEPALKPASASVSAPPLSIDELDKIAGKIEPDKPAEPEDPAPEASEKDGTELSTDLDDSQTEKAVDDIVAREGDVMLALQDAATGKAKKTNPKSSPHGWKAKLRALLRNKWTWVIVAVLLIVLFSLPITRYKLIGLVIKEQLTVTVTDSKTHTPVSSAEVSAHGRSTKTDANGKAVFKVSPGNTTLEVAKKYYKTGDKPLFIGLKPVAAKVSLQATGRQVPITVTNKLTGQPLGGAEIEVLGTAAKTNAAGKAVIVLPTKSATAAAAVSLKGYNTAKVSITITDQAIPANNFALTPAGSVYFLSNASGTIDVIKTDLGGENRHTVLAGTGREDASSTSLLASRDWHYLVLKARRDTPLPALYLIDTSNDKIIQFDSATASFRLVGWYGHSFVYDATRSGISAWQAGREALKSYDAEHQQLSQLDQSQADGNANSFAYQSFLNFYILSSGVLYTTQWTSQTADGSSYNFAGKTDAIRAVQPDGQNKKDYQTFPANTIGSIQAATYGPESIYYAVYDSVSGRPSYYTYQDQAVKPAAITQDDFSRNYPTYLISPSGNQTFWTELRDGQDNVLIGDASAKNPRTIARLDGYTPYGWYSDTYVLVSRNSSELYILSTKAANSQPYKITNYYKPAVVYKGYGYGYGGL